MQGERDQLVSDYNKIAPKLNPLDPEEFKVANYTPDNKAGDGSLYDEKTCVAVCQVNGFGKVQNVKPEQQDVTFCRVLPNFPTKDTKLSRQLIRDSFALVQAQAEKTNYLERAKKAGTTASLAIVSGNFIHYHQIGDSFALVVVIEKVTKKVLMVIPLNDRLHNPYDRAEAARVGSEHIGCSDKDSNTLRLNRNLAVTRSLGDAQHNDLGISHEPDSHRYRLQVDEKKYDVLLVLGTDGVSDRLTLDNIEKLFNRHPDYTPEQYARLLVKHALIAQSMDNISVLVTRLTLNQTTPAPARLLSVWDGHGNLSDLIAKFFCVKLDIVLEYYFGKEAKLEPQQEQKLEQKTEQKIAQNNLTSADLPSCYVYSASGKNQHAVDSLKSSLKEAIFAQEAIKGVVEADPNEISDIIVSEKRNTISCRFVTKYLIKMEEIECAAKLEVVTSLLKLENLTKSYQEASFVVHHKHFRDTSARLGGFDLQSLPQSFLGTTYWDNALALPLEKINSIDTPQNNPQNRLQHFWEIMPEAFCHFYSFLAEYDDGWLSKCAYLELQALHNELLKYRNNFFHQSIAERDASVLAMMHIMFVCEQKIRGYFNLEYYPYHEIITLGKVDQWVNLKNQLTRELNFVRYLLPLYAEKFPDFIPAILVNPESAAIEKQESSCSKNQAKYTAGGVGIISILGALIPWGLRGLKVAQFSVPVGSLLLVADGFIYARHHFLASRAAQIHAILHEENPVQNVQEENIPKLPANKYELAVVANEDTASPPNLAPNRFQSLPEYEIGVRGAEFKGFASSQPSVPKLLLQQGSMQHTEDKHASSRHRFLVPPSSSSSSYPVRPATQVAVSEEKVSLASFVDIVAEPDQLMASQLRMLEGRGGFSDLVSDIARILREPSPTKLVVQHNRRLFALFFSSPVLVEFLAAHEEKKSQLRALKNSSNNSPYASVIEDYAAFLNENFDVNQTADLGVPRTNLTI